MVRYSGTDVRFLASRHDERVNADLIASGWRLLLLTYLVPITEWTGSAFNSSKRTRGVVDCFGFEAPHVIPGGQEVWQWGFLRYNSCR